VGPVHLDISILEAFWLIVRLFCDTVRRLIGAQFGQAWGIRGSSSMTALHANLLGRPVGHCLLPLLGAGICAQQVALLPEAVPYAIAFLRRSEKVPVGHRYEGGRAWVLAPHSKYQGTPGNEDGSFGAPDGGPAGRDRLGPHREKIVI
jgi:hypothetical protein